MDYCITAAAAVNPSGFTILLANGVNVSFINGKTGFTNGPICIKDLQEIHQIVFFQIFVFDNLISSQELFPKTLRRLTTCASVSNTLYGKLVSSFELPFMFDHNLRLTSVAFFQLILIYQVENLIVLHLHYYSEKFIL